MSRYFFLGTVLPSIRVGQEPEISFEELMALYKENLEASDFEKIQAIRFYTDLKNIQKLLKKEEIDHRGTLNEKELDEAIINQEGFPRFVFDFFEEFQEVRDQLRHYSKVFILFFKAMIKKYRGFLREYFSFEREWRVLLAGYRAKKLGLDIAEALQHEDFHDPLIAGVLAQKEAPSFEFPHEYARLGEKLKGASQKPDEQYRLLADFRFRQVEEKMQNRLFSIDYFLGFLVQLMIVEDVFALDEKRGKENLSEIVKDNLG